jgi:hypothetical protein
MQSDASLSVLNRHEKKLIFRSEEHSRDRLKHNLTIVIAYLIALPRPFSPSLLQQPVPPLLGSAEQLAFLDGAPTVQFEGRVHEVDGDGDLR